MPPNAIIGATMHLSTGDMDFLIILPESRKERSPREALSAILKELTDKVSPLIYLESAHTNNEGARAGWV